MESNEEKQTTKAVGFEVGDVANVIAWQQQVDQIRKNTGLEAVELRVQNSIKSLEDRLSQRLGGEVKIVKMSGTEIEYEIVERPPLMERIANKIFGAEPAAETIKPVASVTPKEESVTGRMPKEKPGAEPITPSKKRTRRKRAS